LGYYIRYIVADDAAVTMKEVRSAFAGEEYAVEGDETEATIQYRGRRIGHVTINNPGDGLFDEEREELVEVAQDGDGAARHRVVETLSSARVIVAVQVLFGDGDTSRTLDALSPLWSWLQANRQGLLQADGEGYYDNTGLILALD
jgi:hypothetical protein